jgi:hypothetical protein
MSDAPLRILHLDNGREMRGGQWQVLRLVQGLREAGHTCRLLTRRGSPLEAAARQAGVPVGTLNAWRVWRDSRSADVVHAHDAGSHRTAAWTARAPLIVSRRVAFPVGKGWFSRAKYRRAAQYIAISEAVATELQLAGVAAGHIALVPDGMELPPRALPYEDRPFSPSSIIAPATDDPKKGATLTVEAARLAGLPVQFSRHLADDLRRARLFVYLTQSEGLGSGVLLAMAHAVPVIASRVGGLPEIITDGVNGLLVENDAAAIAAAVRRLWTQRDEAARLAAAGRQTVETRFSVQAMVLRTAAVYRTVLAEPSASLPKETH